MTPGLVLVHHDAPGDPEFRSWIEQRYFPAQMPIMGVNRVQRLRALDAGAPGPYLTVLHTLNVHHTVEAMQAPAWQTLAALAVQRGVTGRIIVSYEQLFNLEG